MITEIFTDDLNFIDFSFLITFQPTRISVKPHITEFHTIFKHYALKKPPVENAYALLSDLTH